VWCVRAGVRVRTFHAGCETELVEMQLCGEEQFVGRAEVAYHSGPKRNEVSPCAEGS